MIKKYMIGLFLGFGEDYTRIKKSTTLEISFEANTEEQDFIADMNPTEVLKNYKTTIPQDLTMFKGEPDFEMMWEKVFNIHKNAEIKCKALVVFMFDGDKSSGYKAWETDANLFLTSINGVDSKINFDINFGGTTKLGTATVTDNKITFTEAEA